ncbi:MAG: 1-acyl-sn-glycerol-3-phosphate acyltransferase [Firmicutes bacterium]|nr:1-acyl-sn-glycerol-3-phosphate acyltransferase [Bacillota bacterium]
MIRTIIFFSYFWLYKVYSLTLLPKVNGLIKRGREEEGDQLINQIAQKWAQSLIKITGSTVEVNGTENIPEGNVLFVSNHQGNFDIPLLIGYIDKPKGFIAKTELKKLPIINTWMEKIHCVFIDRSNLRQSMKAMIESVKLLKSGKNMVLFPEGTRSKGSNVREFKAAGIKVALKSQVPIVPVTIDGSFKIMEENKFIKPAHVKITISEPIYTTELAKEEKDQLHEKLQKIISDNIKN